METDEEADKKTDTKAKKKTYKKTGRCTQGYKIIPAVHLSVFE
jgi:hypothetical protein